MGEVLTFAHDAHATFAIGARREVLGFRRARGFLHPRHHFALKREIPFDDGGVEFQNIAILKLLMQFRLRARVACEQHQPFGADVQAVGHQRLGITGGVQMSQQMFAGIVEGRVGGKSVGFIDDERVIGDLADPHAHVFRIPEKSARSKMDAQNITALNGEAGELFESCEIGRVKTASVEVNRPQTQQGTQNAPRDLQVLGPLVQPTFARDPEVFNEMSSNFAHSGGIARRNSGLQTGNRVLG